MTTIIVLGTGLMGLAWVWLRQPDQRRVALGIVALAGLGFQLFHFAEHIGQMAAWVVAPGRKPFLSSWAMAGRDALAVGGQAALGEELLHLAGNAIFLAGLVALWVLAAGAQRRRGSWLWWALVAQGIHVAEHGLLTVTAWLAGRAIGFTSLFGLLEPGPVLWTVRPWAHFLLNGVASALAFVAVRPWLRGRSARSGRPVDAGAESPSASRGRLRSTP